MLLAIDIGNTAIKLGLFHGDTLLRGVLPHAHSHENLPLRQEIRRLTGGAPLTSAVLCSVVPGVTDRVVEVLHDLCLEPPLILRKALDTGINIAVETLHQTGVDRLVNAVAAYTLCKGPAAAIDFGTCTTVSVADREGRFIGGSIMAGVAMMRTCLKEETAALPLVELAGKAPSLGQNTQEAIRGGLLLGTAGAVERIVYEIEGTIGYTLQRVITGGNAPHVIAFLQRPVHYYERDLILKGLKAIYERHQKGGRNGN